MNKEQQLNTILKWMGVLGGTAASVTLFTKLLNELRSTTIKKRHEMQLKDFFAPVKTVEIDDEDVKALSKGIKSDLKEKLLTKKASDEGMHPIIANALAILVGGGSGIAGLLGINKLYNLYKRRELKHEEDLAKKRYLGKIYLTKELSKLEEESKPQSFRYASVKTAGESLTGDIVDKSLGILLAILGLGAAGSAFLGRSIAKKKFPSVEQKNITNDIASDITAADRVARKIVFKRVDSKDEDKDNDTLDLIEKLASTFEPEINAAMVKMAADIEDISGKYHGINDVINAVALGYGENLKAAETLNTMIDTATEFMMSTKKVASEQDKSIARMYIGRDPIFSEVFVPYAVLEMQDSTPTFNKIASSLNPEDALESVVAFIDTILEDNKNTFSKFSSERLTEEEIKDYMENYDTLKEHEIIGEYLINNN